MAQPKQIKVLLVHSGADLEEAVEIGDLLNGHGLEPTRMDVSKQEDNKLQRSELRDLTPILFLVSEPTFNQNEHAYEFADEVELATAIARRNPGKLIIPLRLDDTPVPGALTLFPSVRPTEEGLRSIADAILQDPSVPDPEPALPDTLPITFDPDVSPQQIVGVLTALANYFRVCGGVGLAVDFKMQEAVVPEAVDA